MPSSEEAVVRCRHIEDCELFPELTSTLEVWKIFYCTDHKRWEECARYKLSLRGQRVPPTLLPNGKDLARKP